jgi:hypothetical protein
MLCDILPALQVSNKTTVEYQTYLDCPLRLLFMPPAKQHDMWKGLLGKRD